MSRTIKQRKKKWQIRREKSNCYFWIKPTSKSIFLMTRFISGIRIVGPLFVRELIVWENEDKSRSVFHEQYFFPNIFFHEIIFHKYLFHVKYSHTYIFSRIVFSRTFFDEYIFMLFFKNLFSQITNFSNITFSKTFFSNIFNTFEGGGASKKLLVANIILQIHYFPRINVVWHHDSRFMLLLGYWIGKL